MKAIMCSSSSFVKIVESVVDDVDSCKVHYVL